MPPAEGAGEQLTQQEQQRQSEVAFSNRKAQLLHRWVGENAAAAAAAAAAVGTTTAAADMSETQNPPAADNN